MEALTATAPQTPTQDPTNMLAATGNAAVGPPIGQGLCLVRVVIKCPAYYVKVRKGEVKAVADDGSTQTVDKKKVTPPSWKWGDAHEIFTDIDRTAKEIEDILNTYSVPDGSYGDRLVNMLAAPEMLAKVEEVRQRRLQLARDLQAKWYSEILPAVKDWLGEQFFYQVRPQLPVPDETLIERFEVLPIVRPLTPITPDQLDLTTLSAEDQQKVVNSQKEILEKMYRDRFQQMFDTLYGSIVEEARDILEGKADAKTGQRSGVGSLETGSRRGGAVEKMLIIFDRVANFHQFTSPEVLDLVNQVRGKLKGKTYEDLNANGGDNKLTASVKGIMGELKALVEQQWELQKSRVDRSIMI